MNNLNLIFPGGGIEFFVHEVVRYNKLIVD